MASNICRSLAPLIKLSEKLHLRNISSRSTRSIWMSCSKVFLSYLTAKRSRISLLALAFLSLRSCLGFLPKILYKKSAGFEMACKMRISPRGVRLPASYPPDGSPGILYLLVRLIGTLRASISK